MSKVPEAVDRWLNTCLIGKQGAATAVIVLFGPLDAWIITTQDSDGFYTTCHILR